MAKVTGNTGQLTAEDRTAIATLHQVAAAG